MRSKSSDQELVKAIVEKLVNVQNVQSVAKYDEDGNAIILVLNHLNLTEIPAEVWQLTSLQELYLHENLLTEIPAEIGQLTSLQHLDLYENQLREIPAEIGQLAGLQILHLAGNQLTQLPLEIGQLSNLQILHLFNNPDLLTPPLEIIEQGCDLSHISNLTQPC